MLQWRYWYLLLASTIYMVSTKSYQTPSVDSSGNKQEELEDFIQAYFDIDESKGRSNPKGFEDVIGVLKEGRDKGNRGPLDDSSPVSSAEGVADGEGETSKEKKQNKKKPGLVNLDEIATLVKKVSKATESALDEDPQPTTTEPPTTIPPPSPATTPTSKRIQFDMAEDQSREGRPPGEVVRADALKTLFINSGRGSSIMIPGCGLSHFHVKSKCAGNLLELTLLSRNPLRGQVRLLEGDGQVNMDGTNLIVYGVLGPLTPSGNLWKLKKQILKEELQSDCYICDNMNVRVVLKVGDSTCGMAVSCQQKGSSRIVNMEDKFVRTHEVMEPTPSPRSPVTTPSPPVSKSGPNSSQGGGDSPIQDPGNTAKTTMSLTYSQNIPDMVGATVSGMVPLGTRMSLVLSVYSRDVTLDLHVVKCQAKGDDGRGVVLVKDGCSDSNVIGEFQEVLGIVQEASFGSHTVRRVSQFAELKAFNFRRSPQNITLICTIKMCGGECTERPSCVTSEINQGRSTRPPVPIFTQEVTLGKVYHASGLPLDPNTDISDLMLDTDSRNDHPTPTVKYPDDCITRQSVLLLLGFVTSAYLGLLLLCIYCVRQSAAKAVKDRYTEDYESPPKALFSEYNSPRRRTPQSSPAHTTFSISTEEYNSPSYQRNVKE